MAGGMPGDGCRHFRGNDRRGSDDPVRVEVRRALSVESIVGVMMG